MKRFILSACCLVLCLSGSWSLPAELRAGVARIEITPPLEMGATLGGYGERMSKPATGVHDRVFAKALVLAQQEKRFALVALDAVGLPPSFKPALLEKLATSGWTPEQILLLPSHSHTSIEMNQVNSRNKLPIPQIGLFKQELLDFLLDRIAGVIEKAARDLRPALAGSQSVDLPEGWVHNRRDGETVSDPVLTVLRIDSEQGGPLAALLNFAAHPTFMDSDDMWFSGDWPGHLQRTLEALIGKGVTVLYSNGAEGDQAPTARPDSGPSRWEKAEHFGRELAIEAYQTWQNATPRTCDAFACHLETIQLPPRCWHPDFMATGGAEYGLRPELMEGVLNELSPAQTTIHSLRVGDFLLTGVPGELVSTLGKEAKEAVRAKTGVKHPVIGGLANEWISYILTPEQYDAGGYEASVSFYGRQLGPTLVAGAGKAAEKLK
jgi:hypothetical protein